MARKYYICLVPDSNTTEAQQKQKEDENEEVANKIASSQKTSIEEQKNHQQQQTENQFVQVSQDMSELVYHLNTIQNDISELAGRPISLTKIED